MSALEAALGHARAGRYVLPLWWVKDGACGCPAGVDCKQKFGKHPLGALVLNGLTNATTDETTIRDWFERYPEANLGLALERSGLMALDIDGHDWQQKIKDAETKLGELPPAPTQRSGSGAYHAVFALPSVGIKGELKTGSGGKITLRGRNYIVIAPSNHQSGGHYEWLSGKSLDDMQAPALPAAWLEEIRADRVEQSIAVPSTFGDESPGLIEAARERLRRHGPAIANGVDGNARTRAAWGILVNDYALSQETAEALLLDWNLTCQPRWTRAELFSGPARDGQSWNSPRGAERVALEMAENYGPLRSQTAPSSTPDTEPAAPPARLGVLVSEVAKRERPPLREYASGMPELDRLLGGGITTRQLLVIMAPPGDGKSALAVATALQLEPNVPVLYASTELESEELAARFAASVLDTSWTEIARGRGPSREDVQRALGGRRIMIVGSELLSRGEAALGGIGQEILAMTSEHGIPPAVFVDYLQDLARGGDEKGVRGRIGDLASNLRAMSQQYDCAILAVSSVSRSYYGTAKAQSMREANDASIYLAAAKESGDVDYAAAAVLFLDVEPNSPGCEFRMARIAVAKSRHGTQGFVGAKFFGRSGRWSTAPAALVLATMESRVEQRREAKVEIAKQKVLATIKANPRKPWRDIRALCHVSPATDADAARNLMVAGGRPLIAEERFEVRDSSGRQLFKIGYRVIEYPADLTLDDVIDGEP